MFVSHLKTTVSSQLDNLRFKSNSHIFALLSYLMQLEKEYHSFVVESEELQEHLWSIKIGISFLLCFVEHSPKAEYVLRIQQLVDELSREVHSFSNQHAESSVSMVQLGCAFSSLREKMSSAVINPETGRREVMDSGKKNNGIICCDINNFLLQSLGDLTEIKANCITDLLEEIKNLKQKLTLSQPLFHFLASALFDFSMNYTLTPLAQLLCRACVILYLCLVEKMDDVMLLSVKAELCDVLHKIDVKKIFFTGLSAYIEKPRVKYECVLLTNVIHFLEFNKSLTQNHQCEDLHEVLKSLQIGIHTILEDAKREDFNASVKTLIWMAIPILFICNKDHKLEASYIEVAELALPQVCDMVRHIQEEFLLLKLHKYPKTHPLGFLEFFCSYIKELQESRAQQIETLKDEFQALYEEFNLLRSCMMQTKQQKELNDLWEQIIYLAYDALYVIDFFLIYESSALIKPSVSRIRNLVRRERMEMEAISTGFKELLTINEKNSIFPPQVNTERASVDFTDQTEKITKPYIYLQSEGIQITEEAKLMPYEGDLGKATSSTSIIPTQVSTFSEIGFVGFEDEVKKAVESLVGNPFENHVVSIVGMPGIGKTTLANKLYTDPIIRGHFDVHAWCTVSQTYRKKELWHSILHQVSGIDAIEYDHERIAVKIAQSLKQRRYLIVMDDMWDIQAWTDLRRYLPKDSKGSRVLITTRHYNVAKQTASVSSNIYNLRMFNEEESFELFTRKIGLKYNYPEDLLQVGHQIALRCQGLPLAISVIAGLVSKVDRKVERWKEIAESLTSCILRDPEMPYRAMLELSYNYLPNHLKPCFLYAGALGACQYIPVRKLKLLWIAEGLIQSSTSENLETQAEEYLMDLISRSLVTPTHNKAVGGVKTCVMHDLLRDFCTDISEEESFMHMINMDSWPQLFGSNDQVLLSQLECFSIWSRGYDFLNERPSSTGLGVQSLLCFSRGQFINEEVHEYDVTFVCMNFKLLRVLNIDEMDICNSIDAIIMLIHLRYLAVGADLQQSLSIPSSIASLWNLQSLIIKSFFVTRIDVIDVPDSLWDMTNLRNVHIDYFARFQVESSRVESSPFPENIETLSRPCFSSTEDVKKLLGRLRNLQKLSCTFLNCWDDLTNCYQFPILDFLTQLVSLKVFWMDSSKKLGARHEFSFPLNLKKLTLTGFMMMSLDEVSIISKKLPNLEVLKIHGSRYVDAWDVGDGDFPNLKYLKLSHKYITKWYASEESFPKLEQLHLIHCERLEEIPHRFEEAPCLQIITVESCNSLLYDSALWIEKMQKEEAQNSEFRVDIRK